MTTAESETAAGPGNSQPPSIPDVVRMVGLGTASAYVLGFVIVNTYLAQFGIRDIDAFSMQYLAAGGAFLALAAIVYFAAYRDLLDLQSAARSRASGLVRRGIPVVQAERLGTAATVVLPIFALSVIHAFVFTSMVGRITAASAVVFGFLMVSYLSALPWVIARKESPLWERWTMLIGHAAMGIGYALWVSVFGQFDERILLLALVLPTSALVIGWWWLTEPSRTFAVRVWALTTLFFSSGLYGLVIYGHVPLKYGGGRSEMVRLVMKVPSEPIGTLLQMEGGISAPIELVAQTTGEYVLVRSVSGKRSVIRINRAEVLGLLRHEDPQSKLTSAP